MDKVSESLDKEEEMEGETNEMVDEITKIINSTLEYVIQNDSKELMKLLTVLKEEASEDYIDTPLKLEEFIGVFLTEEFLDGEPILPKIDELLKELENSLSIPKSMVHRLKMLVDDIAHNRYRVKSIFTRLDDVSDKDDWLIILKELVKEELISTEQFKKLEELEEIDLPAVAAVIKETKIGQGLPFLPRKVSELTKHLHVWLEELAETGASTVRNKISALLKELL